MMNRRRTAIAHCCNSYQYVAENAWQGCGEESSPIKPREKLALYGVESLSDAELLAIIFGTGIRGHSAKDLGQALLKRFGSLHQLMHADPDLLTRETGVGLARHAVLKAALEISRRCAIETMAQRRILSMPEQVKDFLALHFAGSRHEVFVALLDNPHHLLVCQDLFTGTIDGAAVYPREVLKLCFAHNAAAVIFAHNHPSGDPEPSNADVTITQKLRDALALVDIRVLDHIVVGQGQQVSLAERGLM